MKPIFKNSREKIILFFTCTTLLFSCDRNSNNKMEIRGIYGHPQPLWNKEIKLADLHINAIFVHSGSIDKELLSQAKNEGVKVYAEFPVLNGKGYIEAWPINEKGEHVEPASWFMGVCPTDSGFRNYRLSMLRDLLTEFEIDGVWMDYMHWHAQFEEPEPILFETCFCENCLKNFAANKKIELPHNDLVQNAEWILTQNDQIWREWRCEVVAGWASDFKKMIELYNPGILLGVFHCPWTDNEFDGARKRILGIDYDLLGKYADVFSPMVYHARMGRSPEWVAENISWLCESLSHGENQMPEVWPIVQAYNNPEIISAHEFETVLKGGASSCAGGIMMFTTRAVADDEAKIEVMKKVYGSFP